jgi:hypothetical protein
VLDSIYIDEENRKQGRGGKLMENGLLWFKNNKIDNNSIDVVYANDKALPFY